jgi:hypothetical protein
MQAKCEWRGDYALKPSVTWKWIAEHLQMGNWMYVANHLKHKKENDESKIKTNSPFYKKQD